MVEVLPDSLSSSSMGVAWDVGEYLLDMGRSGAEGRCFCLYHDVSSLVCGKSIFPYF